MSTGHTPGPWAVNRADWAENGNVRYELDGIKTVCVADSRLIQAAPDLLAALQALLEKAQWENGSALTELDWFECVVARAAIAKATGEKS